MNRRKLAGAVLGAAVLAITVLSACTDTLRAGIDGVPDGPQFTNRDAATEPATEIPLCIARECPAPYATCTDKSGLCTTNLSNDVEHCGSCDVKCPSEAAGVDAFFICAESRCQMICRENAGDCDHLIDNGCEVALDSDPANCGACGNACAAGEICWKGACGCPSGQTVCNGQCVRLSDDPENCGACGNACEGAPVEAVTWRCGEGVVPDGAKIACVSSKCQTTCQPSRSDCNDDFCGDGCEAELETDAKNCGKCGKKCTDDQICADRKCLCDEGMTRCSFDCVDLQTDPRNCGACGNMCPGPDGASGSPVCIMGRCSYECAVGYGNCDGRLENGCEVDLTNDVRNCGACEVQCDVAAGQPCIRGACLTGPCDAGVIN